MTIVPSFKFAVQEGLDQSFLPTKGNDLATGWDVKCAKETILYNNQYSLVPLGIRVISPDGWWLKLNPRSSTFGKKHLHTLYGVIDQDYRGMIYLAVQYVANADPDTGYGSIKRDVLVPKASVTIKFGDAIGQLIPVQRQDMVIENISNEVFDELAKSSVRGVGGFGSTG